MTFIFIVITPENDVTSEHEMIRKMFAFGLRILHIRKPGSTKNGMKRYISRIPKQYHKRIVLHGHYSLCAEFGLRGIHLTEKARKRNISRYFDPGKHTLSASFHSIRELQKARRRYDYVFLGPIFDSISKPGYKGKWQAMNLSVKLLRKTKVIALGGISRRKIKLVKHSGYHGIAVLGYIWNSKASLRNYLGLKKKLEPSGRPELF